MSAKKTKTEAKLSTAARNKKIIALIRKGPKQSYPESQINSAHNNQRFIDELQEIASE